MIATKMNRSAAIPALPQRFSPSKLSVAARSPDVIGCPGHLLDSVVTEFRRHGAPASSTERAATTPATIVVIDRSLIESLFRDRAAGAGIVRTFDRVRRERSTERRICGMATTSALSIAARRLLIVCDTGQTSRDERTRALRWVRGLAHRIGYECSVNGLHGLATWYTVVVAGTDHAQAAKSVVEWYRTGHVP